jgi:hypothetical protein
MCRHLFSSIQSMTKLGLCLQVYRIVPPYVRSKLYTAKNQYRKFETNIPKKGIARPQSQFPHSSVSDLYIPTIDVPNLLQEICGPILVIYKSLTDT